MSHVYSFLKFPTRWIQSKLNAKQFILFSSVLVGLSAAFAVVILKTFASWIFHTATSFNDKWQSTFFLAILPVFGIFFTVLIVKHFLTSNFVRGTSQILFAVAKKSSIIQKEQMYSQIITGSLTVGMGGSAGLESPIVITGAAFGSNYSQVHQLNYKERTLLLACGVAAGIAAAFNAPIAGVLFVTEVLLIDISISAFVPLIIAAATGALVANIVLNENILLTFKQQQLFNYANVPYYLMMGILAGFISVYHSKIFIWIEKALEDWNPSVYFKAFIGALLLSCLIFLFPPLFGEGYESIKILSLPNPERLLDNSLFSQYKNNPWLFLGFIGLTLLLKSFAAAITVGSGGNGGNFAPSLFVGACLGFLFSGIINLLYPTAALPSSNFTIVGMAGILSGIFHAPLTAIFLIGEITGGYDLMIPLMIVSSISFAISKGFEKYSMDTKKMAALGHLFTDDKDESILSSIDIMPLIETDFVKLSLENTLGELVLIIKKSPKTLFPVLDKDGKLLGVIHFDNIKKVVFDTALYDKIFVSELMLPAPLSVSTKESSNSILKKFDETETWLLPVIQDDHFLGFISKSSILAAYRTSLMTSTIG